MSNELKIHSSKIGGWLEPIDTYEMLAKHQPMLLDGMGAHPAARYAYVAMSPRLEARLTDGTMQVADAVGVTKTKGKPLELIRSLLAQWTFPQPEPGFLGGWICQFSYEFSRAIEPTLPAAKRHRDIPDAILRLCRDTLVFDRQQKNIHLYCADLPGETDAQSRLQQIKSLIEAGNLSSPDMREPVKTDWRPTMGEQDFCRAVRDVQELISQGDLFQANIATSFEAPQPAPPVTLFRRMQASNPSPFMALLDWDDHTVVSNSPEQLFEISDGNVSSRPIAGTRPRGKDDAEEMVLEHELCSDAKEQAEHTMLVDLVRNDIAKVSQPGTVEVPELASVERYQRVMHLVSRVQGKLRANADVVDCLTALFPGGTITGAPKHRACLRIHEAELGPRGVYTGSAGFVSWDQQTAHLNIMIRTMVLQRGKASVHAGSGIVRGSVPQLEWREANNKAASLLAPGGTPATRVGEVTRKQAWIPPSCEPTASRVLLVDNYDSFVFNLANYCASAGAEVRVMRNDEAVQEAISDWQPTHVVLGPGPGWPEESGATIELAAKLPGILPVLGVCLGHQALAQASGALVMVAETAAHGETHAIHHEGIGLLKILPSPLPGARYHSLIVDEVTLAEEWVVDARLADGTVMSMHHRNASAFGLQFHPESIGTQHGLDILNRFLRTR